MTSLPIFVPGATTPILGSVTEENTYRWATITDTDPLRIRLDGDPEGLPVTPDSLINPSAVSIGDRVWVQLFGRRLIVLGKARGGSVDAPFEEATAGESDFPWGTSMTYANDAVDDPFHIIAKGELVTLAGRVKSTITRSAATVTMAATIPARFRPLAGQNGLPFHRRVHPTTFVMNGGNAVGPIIRCEVNAATGEIEFYMFASQTPTWTSSTWITVYGSWFREYPVPAP